MLKMMLVVVLLAGLAVVGYVWVRKKESELKPPQIPEVQNPNIPNGFAGGVAYDACMRKHGNQKDCEVLAKGAQKVGDTVFNKVTEWLGF